MGELPVKVSGNVHSGFTAEFTPQQVGPHTISVDYNGHPIYGTPFVCKVYDSKKVLVGDVPKGQVGNTLQFTGNGLVLFRRRNFSVESPPFDYGSF